MNDYYEAERMSVAETIRRKQQLAIDVIDDNPQAALDMILDLLLNGEVLAPTIVRYSSDQIEDAAVIVLGIISKQIPNHFMEIVKPFLNDPQTRRCLIRGIGENQSPEVIPWLEPLTHYVDSWEEDDVVWLIDTIGDTKCQAAERLLKELRDTISSDKLSIHHELSVYLNYYKSHKLSEPL